MLPADLPRGAMPAMPAGAKWISAFGGTPGYEGPGGGSVDDYELVLWAIKTAHLDVGTMTLNQIHSTLLPTQSSGERDDPRQGDAQRPLEGLAHVEVDAGRGRRLRDVEVDVEVAVLLEVEAHREAARRLGALERDRRG
jgi:hypothetical protein